MSLNMPTQALLDFTDVVIVVAFAASTLALVAHVWRDARRHHRHDRIG